MNQLHILPHIDSDELASAYRRALDIPRDVAKKLGHSAVAASREGAYVNRSGERVDISGAVESACAARISIAPADPLPERERVRFPATRIQVSNESTFGASRRLVNDGLRPLALNFANGVHPGGGFLHGARAQEETICRSSALYLTLVGDRMYEEHARRPLPDSTDWCILSPDVPVFREDDGSPLAVPWLLSVITCAAPVAHRVGVDESASLLSKRIHRLLAVASAHGYETLVVGAWGCGAFGNDPRRTAADFRSALETEFRGAFSQVVFAITDWSPERKFLGPFRDVFMSEIAHSEKMPEDPFQLQRFVEAQADSYAQALSELRGGRKDSHWMWYVFPQFDGLGRSEIAQRYAIKSLAEAAAYLKHPVLGGRLAECCEVMLALDGRTARDIFGVPDDLKFRSSITLFATAEPGIEVFHNLITKYFEGLPDQRTLEIIGALPTLSKVSFAQHNIPE